MESATAKHGIETASTVSPARLVDKVLNAPQASDPRFVDLVKNLADNRDEAEKFIAGMLGLM